MSIASILGLVRFLYFFYFVVETAFKTMDENGNKTLDWYEFSHGIHLVNPSVKAFWHNIFKSNTLFISILHREWRNLKGWLRIHFLLILQNFLCAYLVLRIRIDPDMINISIESSDFYFDMKKNCEYRIFEISVGNRQSTFKIFNSSVCLHTLKLKI